jgi:colanic acid biosynthesis protein WcaH
MSAPLLSADVFLDVVKHAPLVSIDLLVRRGDGPILMGRRTNEPARDTWFVPGGCIQKSETLDAAFARIALKELGFDVNRSDATLHGVYTHLYDANFAEAPDVSTHYVVLAYEWTPQTIPTLTTLPTAEHREYSWQGANDPRDDIHPNNYPYFQPAQL